MLGPLVAVLMALENQVDVFFEQQVHECRAYLARLLSGGYANLVHTDNHPLDATRSCVLYCARQPSVVRCSRRIVVSYAVDAGVGTDQDKSGQVADVEEVLDGVVSDRVHPIWKARGEIPDESVGASVVFVISHEQLEREGVTETGFDVVAPCRLRYDFPVAEITKGDVEVDI